MPRVDLPNLLRSQAGYGVLFIYHKHKCVVAKGHINQLHARVRRCLPLVGVGIGSQHQIDRVRIIHHNALAFDSGKWIGLALRQPVIGIGRGGEIDKAVHVAFLQTKPLPRQLHGHGYAHRAAIHAGIGAPIADIKILIPRQGLLFAQMEAAVGIRLLPVRALADGLVDLAPGVDGSLLRTGGQDKQHAAEQQAKQLFHRSSSYNRVIFQDSKHSCGLMPREKRISVVAAIEKIVRIVLNVS